MKGAEYKWSALNADVYCDHGLPEQQQLTEEKQEL
jgi:hypothetical protein